MKSPGPTKSPRIPRSSQLGSKLQLLLAAVSVCMYSFGKVTSAYLFTNQLATKYSIAYSHAIFNLESTL